MKDKNEYGKNIVEKVERLRLGKIIVAQLSRQKSEIFIMN